jgi:hypothetical protein
MSMTPEAKGALCKTIQALRERLLRDLHDATEAAYRPSIRLREAKLDEAARARRLRLEAWITEQVRAQGGTGTRSKEKRTSDDSRRDAEKQAAYTLINRLVILRLMEAPSASGQPLREPAVVTGGWESRGFKQFRELAPALVRGDDTEGYAFLLRLAFEDLATELPGVFGAAGIAELIPVPAATLRHAVEALDQPELESCWTDDMTLGWVYQYWNDPERKRLDDKLNPKTSWGSGKIEPHEIASKTQMFTERYMVDWLLQNSLGPMWLAMCKKHGWAPAVEADGTLQRLEERRVEWRAKRDGGEVSLTELMPLHTEAERRWTYYVPQPIPPDAVVQAPASVRDLKILDPAVGSGHFLVVALDLLLALYREEARHRGQAGEGRWGDAAIVERILSHNLHGIDLDPRAVQIAAAALWLKARQLAPEAKPERLNLVASDLKLGSLSDEDPALVELRREVEHETGVPGELTDMIVQSLRGADHLGSLLKVDAAVEEAWSKLEAELGRVLPQQGDLYMGFAEKRERVPLEKREARESLLGRLERFLAQHTGGDDLGLRLRGEQLAAGVRFVRILREGVYDLVVANPPYQGASDLVDMSYVEKMYALGKANLYAAFLLRGLELVREGGVSAMLTMRNWMFSKQYAGLRAHVLGTSDMRALGDIGTGAFSERNMDSVISSAIAVCRRAKATGAKVVAVQAGDPQEQRFDTEKTLRRAAALSCGAPRFEFDPMALKVVPQWPLVYWWDDETLSAYRRSVLLGNDSPARFGLTTGDNSRFCRFVWEGRTDSHRTGAPHANWVPLVHGAKGDKWIDPSLFVIKWHRAGTEVQVKSEWQYGTVSKQIRNPEHYFELGVAFSAIGSSFTARAHRRRSVFSNTGLSLFPTDISAVVCSLNCTRSVRAVSDLAPGLRFDVGDVNRLPLFPIAGAGIIFAQIQAAFVAHEAHREASVEFKHPGSSPWRHAQDWAQLAVDRPEGAPLPEYIEELDPEPPTDHLSFALGVAIGRFGARSPDGHGEGILDPRTDDLRHALAAGILFLDTTLDAEDQRDSLGHPAAAPLLEAWKIHGPAIAPRRALRDWLALDYFKDVHKGMYESRPIHWPLSSEKKTFVAWVNIHRMDERTLVVLLADHLQPALSRIEGELTDLRQARDGADRRAARDAERRYDKVLKARDELAHFIADVEQCADKGPLPPDNQCSAREQDARYAPDLDDGVMINSAALWKLLEPQGWKEPKKWWKELATASGKKGYDWAHLAMSYWPTRVDENCQKDPSLGVAHGCFWRYHPERAWAWELRLQDELGIAPVEGGSWHGRIEEPPYRPGGRDLGDQGEGQHRAAWLRDHATEALAAVETEALRRMGRGKARKVVPELRILERGLWSALPGEVWVMELRLSERQGAEFRLRSPDEADARTEFEAAHPELVRARGELLATLSPDRQLFDEDGTGEDGLEDEDGTLVEEDVS